jgi:hypothetical protein
MLSIYWILQIKVDDMSDELAKKKNRKLQKFLLRITKILDKLKIDLFKLFFYSILIFFMHWTTFNYYLISALPLAPSPEYAIVIIYRTVRSPIVNADND